MEDLPAAAFASSTANAHEAADISPNPARLDSRFLATIMNFSMRRVRDRHDAEDLTQEVFARAPRSGVLARVQRPDSFLFTVAPHLPRARHRQAIRRAAAGGPAASGLEPQGPVE